MEGWEGVGFFIDRGTNISLSFTHTHTHTHTHTLLSHNHLLQQVGQPPQHGRHRVGRGVDFQEHGGPAALDADVGKGGLSGGGRLWQG